MSGLGKAEIKSTGAKGAQRSAAPQGIESAAALAATTGVFLAGAVSGALAEVMDDRARMEAAQVQQPERASDPPPSAQQPEAQDGTPAAAEKPVVEATATEATHADPTAPTNAANPPVQSLDRSGGMSADAPASMPGAGATHQDERGTQPAADAAKDDTAQSDSAPARSLLEAIGGSDAPDFGKAFEKLSTLVESLEAKQSQLSERLDQTVGQLGETIAARVDTALSAATFKLDAALERLDHSLDTTLAKVTDIPQSLLGADHDAGSSGGLLATLFGNDGDPVAPAPEQDHAPSVTAGGLQIDLPYLASTVEAVKIGFSGQSYSDVGGDFDTSAGAHGSLLHGLL
ncbi:hypothetical protein [Bosea beijingensis]|uniref:hypothetical protein n=1 Tax=Bosea beijingensis TaxID=3068632 RepID=UPI002740D45B|nr:hypothetical protein [Bosea sp. REN20]